MLKMSDGDGGLRKVVSGDVHFPGSPVHIERLAIGVIKEEIAELECELTITTARTHGFAGNRKMEALQRGAGRVTYTA
jgi:hypothetical protein